MGKNFQYEERLFLNVQDNQTDILTGHIFLLFKQNILSSYWRTIMECFDLGFLWK